MYNYNQALKNVEKYDQIQGKHDLETWKVKTLKLFSDSIMSLPCSIELGLDVCSVELGLP